jgi:hypothetical protein
MQTHCAGDGGQQARRTRETTYKPFQPSRREGRVFSARPVVTAACIFFCRRATGAASARPSQRPPFVSRADLTHSSGAMRRGRRWRMSARRMHYGGLSAGRRHRPHGSRRRCAAPHHEGLARRSVLHLTRAQRPYGEKPARLPTCFEPNNAAPPLTLRRPPKAGVSKGEAGLLRRPGHVAGEPIPSPGNLSLTAVNRTLTIHRAKIAGWNVRVVVGCG